LIWQSLESTLNAVRLLLWTTATCLPGSLPVVDWLLWWGETAVSALRPWACCTIPGW
jgi:hypothetical protein